MFDVRLTLIGVSAVSAVSAVIVGLSPMRTVRVTDLHSARTGADDEPSATGVASRLESVVRAHPSTDRD